MKLVLLMTFCFLNPNSGWAIPQSEQDFEIPTTQSEKIEEVDLPSETTSEIATTEPQIDETTPYETKVDGNMLAAVFTEVASTSTETSEISSETSEISTETSETTTQPPETTSTATTSTTTDSPFIAFGDIPVDNVEDPHKLSIGEAHLSLWLGKESPDPVVNTTSELSVEDKRLSSKIRQVIETYRKVGTVTIPGADVPDPLAVPDIKKTVAGTPAQFTNMNVYGLSKFSVDHVNTDLDKMQVFVAVFIERLVILGNYSIKSWFTRGSGPFNVTLLDVEASGAAALGRNENGDLYATDSQMDMSFLDARVHFKNFGMLGGLFQGVLGSAAPVLFEGVKPFILKEINNKIRNDVNAKIKTIGDKIALNKTARPIDMAMAEGRKYVKENGYDPYHVRDYVIRHSIFTLNISHFVLDGLSNFDRIGDIVLSMDKGTIQIGVRVATVALTGKCRWKIGVGQGWSKAGSTNFTVDHFQVRAFVNQSLDVKQHPVLQDLDLNVGRVRLQMEGTGNFDAVIGIVVTTLPDLIRHIIVDALEEPIKYKVQNLLNDVDVESLLEKGLPELDKIGL